MGLFGLFRQKGHRHDQSDLQCANDVAAIPDCKADWADSSSIADDERPYYQPDSYYVFETNPDGIMNRRVRTLDELASSTNLSRNGLCASEIMLLDYCSRGKYPKPNHGYPGFWWFKYGIRDVGGALGSLESRGFVKWATKANCLRGLKVAELRDILKLEGLSCTGRKDELIDRIVSTIPDERIAVSDSSLKYELTELGETELRENGYVPYMHSHRHLTADGLPADLSFTVWDINALFPKGVDRDWRTVVGEIEMRRFGVNMASHATLSGRIVKADPVSAESILQALKDESDYISKQISCPGNGYDEASMGYDYCAIGEDAKALVQLFIAAGKKFDAPAVYKEASEILLKYGLKDEAADVLTKGIANVSAENSHRQDLMVVRGSLVDAASD